MQDSGENDNLIKTPVQKLVRDLTEKYVRETVKEAARQLLQKRGDEHAEMLDFARKDGAEKGKEQLIKEFEDKISRVINDCSTDATDLQREIESIMEKELYLVPLDIAQKSSKMPSGERPRQGYLIKSFLALLLISAGVYFALDFIFPAQLSVSTTNLDFGIMDESLPSPLTFAISNLGRGTLSWSVHSDDPWIGLSPSSGTNNGLVTVSIQGPLEPGMLTGTIYVRSGNQQSQKIQVNLQVKSAPGISIYPGILTFTKRTGERQIPASQTLGITNSGESTLYWNAEADSSWISQHHLEGTDDGNIQVGITGNQDPGIYHGTITIKSNDKNIEVPVTLEVIAPAKLAISPNPLAFSFAAYGSIPPQPQTFWIANNGGAALNWYTTTEPWITATPASGQLEGGKSQEISVGIDVRNLDYSDRTVNLAIDSNGGSVTGSVVLKRETPLR
jgi:hypothetical protein